MVYVVFSKCTHLSEVSLLLQITLSLHAKAKNFRSMATTKCLCCQGMIFGVKSYKLTCCLPRCRLSLEMKIGADLLNRIVNRKEE